MLSPTLHCIVITLIMLIILCRYAMKSFGYYPALVKYDNKGTIPSYIKDSMQRYFKKSAAFKRCFAALIFAAPFFIGTSFIILLSVNYLAYTNLKMNSWALVREAYEVSIKNDPEFMYNFGIVTLLIMGFVIAFTLLYTICKSVSIHKEAKLSAH